MTKYASPSDFTSINPNYTTGNGYYTTHADVSDLLQISTLSGGNDTSYFTASTTPSMAMVGKIVKRVEEKIDDTIGYSFRPIIHKDEYHSFEFFRHPFSPMLHYQDFVGFIQLNRMKLQKVVKLEGWHGNSWLDLASASALHVPQSTVTTSEQTYTLTLGVGEYSFVLTEGTDFYDSFGPKTTVRQLCSLINEVYPHDTAQFTGETAAKSKQDTTSTVNVSDFFYASVDSEDGTRLIITSLLPGDDGASCTIASTFGSVENFTDNEDVGRLGDYWTIGHEGKIFFLKNYPYIKSQSIKVTYVSGDRRVPAWVHEIATKLVASEVLVHDDNSILIAETGANIDLRTKHEILVKEATEMMNSKKAMMHLIE